MSSELPHFSQVLLFHMKCLLWAKYGKKRVNVCVHDTLGYLHKGVHADRRCTEFICDGGPRCLATTDTVSWTDVLKCAMTLRHCWDM